MRLGLGSAVAAGLLVSLSASACAGVQEAAVLSEFFGAARLRDKTALAAIATTSFEPHVHGIVTTFEITRLAAERQTQNGVSKEVTIVAPVRTFDGGTLEQTLVVTLQRTRADRRWMVTAIRAINN